MFLYVFSLSDDKLATETDVIYMCFCRIKFLFCSSPPHLIVFSILLCILPSSSSLPPLLPSSHLS